MRFLTIALTLTSIALHAENRLADPKFKTHCGGAMTKSECAEQLQDSYETHCVTEEEFNYGNYGADGLLRVPICGVKKHNFMAWCFCSCLAKGTKVLVIEVATNTKQWLPIEIVVKNREIYQFVVPAANATMDNMQYDTAEIDYWSAGEEEGSLVVIKLIDGSELSLTPNHSVLLHSGSLVDAEALQIGNALVRYDGKPLDIVDIKRSLVQEEVFNVWLNKDSPNGHILFAEGITVGDALWENSPEDVVSKFKFNK